MRTSTFFEAFDTIVKYETLGPIILLNIISPKLFLAIGCIPLIKIIKIKEYRKSFFSSNFFEIKFRSDTTVIKAGKKNKASLITNVMALDVLFSFKYRCRFLKSVTEKSMANKKLAIDNNTIAISASTILSVW